MSGFNHNCGQYVTVDGADLYVEIKGKETGHPLVFLHGGLGTIEDFNPILSNLALDYRLIGIDSRGQGKSTLGTEKLTYRRIEQDVAAVWRELDLGPVTLIGHSDGGIAALRLAAEKDILINKVVTIGAHWMLNEEDPIREMYAGVTAESWYEMFPEEVEIYRSLNPEPDFHRITRAVVELWLDSSAAGYPGETVREISCDLLVIRGDDDMLVSRTNALELAERVNGAKLLNLPFAGHSAHEEQPETVLWALRTFLAADETAQGEDA
ncbi:alpha/beta fold hydrolase [Pararhizobium sp. PWRC1-1]|uniref:alpha/beta fold hydrolase n=1 Tax=Pararhizobium sp. PWRC1-1 TaxID=2804566 RepID=UPI003CEBECD3